MAANNLGLEAAFNQKKMKDICQKIQFSKSHILYETLKCAYTFFLTLYFNPSKSAL